MRNSRNEIINAMTIDVEDYFQVSAFESYINKNQWDRIPHRVEKNTNRILDILSEYNVNATFFTLGWVAKRYPQLINRIINEGHELACHGYEHIRVTEQSPKKFRIDIVKTKKLLEDLGGKEIKGYRAASYSIGANNLWAHDVLFEEGFKYSSSVYPVKHDLYGMPEAPRFMYEPLDNTDFKEIPISTIKLVNTNIPCGGGGFFRFYPYFFSRQAYRYINNKEKQSGIFYFHPWEIDTKQPRQQNIDLKTRFRHYLNLNKVEQRIINLLHDFNWDTMDNVFLNG